jgi:predicted MFS family arabinose efflux permease
MNPQQKQLTATLLATASAALLFLLLPLIAGWISDRFQLDEQTAGLILSIYFGGFLLTSVLAYATYGKVRNLSTIQLGYLLLAPGFVLCGLATTTWLLSAGLALCGIGSGFLYGTGVSIVAEQTQSERAFGGMVATQQISALVLIYSLPVWVYPNYGYAACWFVLAAIVILTGFSSGWIAQDNDHRDPQPSVGAAKPATLGLVSLLFHFCMVSAVWTFVERLGIARGFSIEDIALSLALSLAGGLGGALIAAAVGDRFGTAYPHLVSAGAFLVAFYFLAQSAEWLNFLAAVILISAAWTYCLSYQMASVGNLSHQMAVLIPGVQGVAAMLGPPLGGWMISQSGYTGLMMGSGLVITLSSLAFCYQSMVIARPAINLSEQ